MARTPALDADIQCLEPTSLRELSEQPEPGPTRVLLVEDNPGDVRLLTLALAEDADAHFDLVEASRLSQAFDRLDRGDVELVLLDLTLPDGHGLDTFHRTHERAPDVAIVVLTGLDDESVAVRAVRDGAQDYLVKGQVSGQLLARSMRYAIERKRLALERERLIADLRKALDEIKTLSGMLPICASCKKIRDDKGYWNQIETYIRERSEAEFSHGICPDCLGELYPEQRTVYG